MPLPPAKYAQILAPIFAVDTPSEQKLKAARQAARGLAERRGINRDAAAKYIRQALRYMRQVLGIHGPGNPGGTIEPDTKAKATGTSTVSSSNVLGNVGTPAALTSFGQKGSVATPSVSSGSNYGMLALVAGAVLVALYFFRR